MSGLDRYPVRNLGLADLAADPLERPLAVSPAQEEDQFLAVLGPAVIEIPIDRFMLTGPWMVDKI